MTLKKVSLVFLILLVYGAIIFLVYLWVNREPESTRRARELQTNYQKWQTQAIGHYRMSVKIICLCEFPNRNTVVVEVKNGNVVSVIDNKGQNISISEGQISGFAHLFTVDGLFTYASDAVSGAYEAHIAYDPQFGFPTDVSVDWDKQILDDEDETTITNFEPLP